MSPGGRRRSTRPLSEPVPEVNQPSTRNPWFRGEGCTWSRGWQENCHLNFPTTHSTRDSIDEVKRETQAISANRLVCGAVACSLPTLQHSYHPTLIGSLVCLVRFFLGRRQATHQHRPHSLVNSSTGVGCGFFLLLPPCSSFCLMDIPAEGNKMLQPGMLQVTPKVSL